MGGLAGVPDSEEIKRGTMSTLGWSVSWKDKGSVRLMRHEKHTK